MQVETILAILEKAIRNMTPTMSSQIVKDYGRDPFLILISCLLSLRAKDLVTLKISRELFLIAKTPQGILDIPLDHLEKIIFKSGFYKKKAKNLRQVCEFLIKNFNSIVPDTREELLLIPGVGRKTANLVLAQGFGIPAICVDTHVHRISNRIGLVKTVSPEETEFELMKIVPRDKWIEINNLLVIWGQNICVPISPFCSKCPLNQICKKVGVNKSR